jgi:hypothetical protein
MLPIGLRLRKQFALQRRNVEPTVAPSLEQVQSDEETTKKEKKEKKDKKEKKEEKEKKNKKNKKEKSNDKQWDEEDEDGDVDDIPSTDRKPISLKSIDERISQLEQDDNQDNETYTTASEEFTAADEPDQDIVADDFKQEELVEERDADGNIVRIYSILQRKERINPLTTNQLPLPKYLAHALQDKKKENRKRKVQFNDESADTTTSRYQEDENEERKRKINSIQSIQKVIREYVPSSHLKLPFYCRFCQFQGKDLEEYNQHIDPSNQSHTEQMKFHRKVCFCKVCKKQFTSPEQLKEHFSGKAHQERIEKRNQYYNSNRNSSSGEQRRQMCFS